MADELLDQVDKNDNVIGSVWKSEAHSDPNIVHREVGIILFNDKDETLLQQRSYDKKNDPGCWKNTCGGHIGAGENPQDAVVRELYEELGLKAKPIFYKKYFKKHLKKGENRESRFIWIYYSVVLGHPKITIDQTEVNNARWVKIDDLEEFAKNNDYDLKGFSQKIIIEIAKKLKII